MLRLFLLLVTTILRVLRAAGRSRSELVLENIALRQQVGVLKQKRPLPRLDNVDRTFWVAMRLVWRSWAERLVIVEPATVVKWHRELFDHVVVRGESHAVRLARAYIGYFHEDRTHLGLGKDTPSRRPVTLPPSPTAKVVPTPRLGGLHHRYERREAA